jgi:hypothetical protein
MTEVEEVQKKPNEEGEGSPSRREHLGHSLFRFIARRPYLFCVVIPVIFTVLVAVGFTRDDYVEDRVGEIWVPTSDQSAENRDYLESIDKPEFTASSFAAMSISRDGGNLFTATRLEEIRQRMDAVENHMVRTLYLVPCTSTSTVQYCTTRNPGCLHLLLVAPFPSVQRVDTRHCRTGPVPERIAAGIST